MSWRATARAIVLWVSGLLASGILVGGAFALGDESYRNDGAFPGFLAGLFGFICLRLWLTERRD